MRRRCAKARVGRCAVSRSGCVTTIRRPCRGTVDQWVKYGRGARGSPAPTGENDPDKFDGGWLRTGDVGRIDPDGYLTLTDRAKDVISQGRMDLLVELENTLIGHPAIYEAAVVAVPDDKWQERPLALVVVHRGAEVDIDRLRAFLLDKVAKSVDPSGGASCLRFPEQASENTTKKAIRARHSAGEYQIETS